MTVTIAFDTHRYVKRLIAVGMPENQAEVIADEQRALIEDQLATKQDIKALETAMQLKFKQLEANIKQLEATTKRDIKESEQRLIIRLGGMMIAGFGVIATLIKLP